MVSRASLESGLAVLFENKRCFFFLKKQNSDKLSHIRALAESGWAFSWEW